MDNTNSTNTVTEVADDPFAAFADSVASQGVDNVVDPFDTNVSEGVGGAEDIFDGGFNVNADPSFPTDDSSPVESNAISSDGGMPALNAEENAEQDYGAGTLEHKAEDTTDTTNAGEKNLNVANVDEAINSIPVEATNDLVADHTQPATAEINANDNTINVTETLELNKDNGSTNHNVSDEESIAIIMDPSASDVIAEEDVHDFVADQHAASSEITNDDIINDISKEEGVTLEVNEPVDCNIRQDVDSKALYAVENKLITMENAEAPDIEPMATPNDDSEHVINQVEDDAYIGEGNIVDKLPNEMSIQNASTEEEAEWLSMGLGLADALKQIVALTEERDVALAMCQEKEEQQDANAQSEALLVEVQSRLQAEMDRRAESDSEVRKLREEIQKYEDQLVKYSTLEDDYEQAQANLVMVVSEKSRLEVEIIKLREFKDESEQKEVLLSSRLNEAKKKEANKGQAAGRLEAENEALKEDLEKTKIELNAMTQAKAKVESNMEKLKAKAVERVKQAETALAEERELNEERKRKMKTFVESKADELREAKESASDMQIELQETRTSLRSSRDREESIQQELEASRLKYRELQRDMERLKRNQQEMHKMGSTLEHELEKSASETEEHKKKRMSAKHELMTMVRTLELEKSVSSKLRESIKFTFTPKALSQQQLLTECLKDFEVELERLATKLGKNLSLPRQEGDHPTSGESPANTDSQDQDANGSKKGKRNARASKADTDTERLISNLEHETQHVSKGIMSLAGSIERLRSLMDEDHTFNCMAYFSNVLAAVGHHEARHQRLGNITADDDREESVSITSFDQGSSTL
jgi:chromosome segregation ATPase